MLIGDEIHAEPGTHSCPLCGKITHCTPRRPMDRVASIFVPLRRWTCTQCGWTGTRPSQKGRARRREWLKTYGWLLLGALLVFLAIGGGFLIVRNVFGPKPH